MEQSMKKFNHIREQQYPEVRKHLKKVGKNVIRMKDVAKIELGMQGFYDLPMHNGTKKGLAIYGFFN